MAGAAVDIRAFVARIIPGFTTDDFENTKAVRSGRYRELYVMPMVRKTHALADEGSYFVVNNGAGVNGLATAAAQAVFSDTASAFLYGENHDKNKSAYLDWLNLIVTAAGTAGTAIFLAVTVDNTFRAPAATGTELTANISNPNGNVARQASIMRWWSGGATPLVLAASSKDSRTVVAARLLKGAIGIANDTFLANFGGVEANDENTTSTVAVRTVQLPPVIVAPGGSAAVHIWLPSQSAASSYAPEVGWWER